MASMGFNGSRTGDRPSSRRWIHRLVPVSIVILIVGSLVAVLGRAVSKARNAAMSAGTT
jgi:hypothetical protein